MPVIRVLKAFVFSHPATGRQRTTTETRFTPGEHVVSDEVANHHWIASGADGRIESAAQTVARAKAEAAKAELAKEDAERANAHAQAAVARLKAAEPVSADAAAEIERNLNTPVNILRNQVAGAEPGTLVEVPSPKRDAVVKADEDETDEEAVPGAVLSADKVKTLKLAKAGK